jgi:hypothetical protein
MKDTEGTKAMETIPNPPSFYYNDIEKWNAKFSKHIKERDQEKRQMAKTHTLSLHTRNTNIKAPEDVSNGVKGKGGSLDPANGRSSLFNTVLKRRKSR